MRERDAREQECVEQHEARIREAAVQLSPPCSEDGGPGSAPRSRRRLLGSVGRLRAAIHAKHSALLAYAQQLAVVVGSVAQASFPCGYELSKSRDQRCRRDTEAARPTADISRARRVRPVGPVRRRCGLVFKVGKTSSVRQRSPLAPAVPAPAAIIHQLPSVQATLLKAAGYLPPNAPLGRVLCGAHDG